MWKRVAILTWAALVFVIGWYVWQVTASEAEANIYLYPTGNGAVQEWNVSPANSSHYQAVDDPALQPAVPDITNYLYVGSAGSGAEREDLVFRVSSQIGGITGVAIWFYGENLGCVGGGQNNCDSITLSLPDYGKTIGTFTPPGGKRGWMSKSATFADPFFLPAGFDNNVALRLQRTAMGGGSNKDTIALAAVYVQFTTTTDQKDPTISEKGLADGPPQSTAVERMGKMVSDPPEEKGGGDDLPQSGAILRSGGADAE